MAFYIRKSLAHGAIRFGVLPRGTDDAIDRTGSLSTGPRGEFLRKRHRGFFSAEDKIVRSIELPKTEGIGSTPFWKSVVDGTSQGWLYLGMIVFGALLVLLGLVVVARTSKAGWVEVVIGLALIATPLIRTAQVRKQVREREEKDRVERETTERRHREMLSSYTTALDRLRAEPNDISLAAVARERERLELPYEVWSPFARHTVLAIGFDALGRLGPSAADEVSELMKRASAAVGLAPSDELNVRVGLYRVAAWHILADDRANEMQRKALGELRRGLGIRDTEVANEDQAAQEFARLVGFTSEHLPREDCGFPLGFHEYCVRVAKGSLLKRLKEKVDGRRVDKLVPDEQVTVVVTNKRIIVDAKKKLDIPLGKIDDVELDADTHILTIRTARTMRNLDLQLEEPIYTGGLIDLVLSLDERPRGFA